MAEMVDELTGPEGLADAILDLVGRLYPSSDLEDTFGRICRSAVTVLDACDVASVTTVSRDRLSTHGATSQLAVDADLMQYEVREGPCLDAATRERWVVTSDVQRDERWPAYSRRLVGELDVHSMMAVRLATHTEPTRSLGGLNLYSTRIGSFDDPRQRELALVLAAVASVAAEAARTHAQLVEAVRSRQVIGEAIGMLRVQSDLTRDQAFEALSGASQRMNLKLRDIAARIADGDPLHEAPEAGRARTDG
jgi:transcriptional regulator with GAF, ATPase, and Fis domain